MIKDAELRYKNNLGKISAYYKAKASLGNIETMKVIVQSGSGVAIVPRPCADNEASLGVLKVLAIAPARTVALSLFRRRQPLSRRKEGYLAALRDALKD